MATQPRKTIRFEDLGEPVQKLIRSLKGDVSEEDMALLEYVSVKDMAKIYQEMSSERRADQIWEELRNALIARREKAERKRRELEARQAGLEAEAQAAADEAAQAQRLAEEEKAEQERQAEEHRRRKEERRRRRAEAAAQQEEAQPEEAAQQEQETQQDDEEKKHQEEEQAERQRHKEEKARRHEEKARKLAEEQERLHAEQQAVAVEEKKRKKGQKKDWEDYVANHPLEFTKDSAQLIPQVEVEHNSKPPPTATQALLNRTWTPKCPNCHAKFSKPPPEWDCPMCLRRLRQHYKTWQPDEEQDLCMICKSPVGRFSRHHCRNCGRVVCAKCTPGKAFIPSIGFKEAAVRICTDCQSPGAANQQGGEASPSPSPARDK